MHDNTQNVFYHSSGTQFAMCDNRPGFHSVGRLGLKYPAYSLHNNPLVVLVATAIKYPAYSLHNNPLAVLVATAIKYPAYSLHNNPLAVLVATAISTLLIGFTIIL